MVWDTQRVFERFTERARQVIVFAQDEARTLKHPHIGTEHLVLGLMRDGDGVAFAVLNSLGITLEQVRAEVIRGLRQGDQVVAAQMPFTPRAKNSLNLALREALRLGHNYIGTEHILLGVVREDKGVGARILVGFGADAETVRNDVIRTLGGPVVRGDGLFTRIVFSCPTCGERLEVITDSPSEDHFLDADESIYTCPSCGETWHMRYHVEWNRTGPPS
jgi:predicted RNA-binding Zn-ribbon protein involved in translation (DUF1610 family)